MSYIAGSGMQLINSSILGSDTTAPAFSSIPGNFNNLRLELMGRTDDAASNADIFMRFNSDSGNNYDYQYFVGANTSSIIGTAQAVNGMLIGTFPANNATASCAGIIIIDIVAYAKTSFLKVYQSTFGFNAEAAANAKAGIQCGQYRSTNAITAVSFFDGSGGKFKTNSTFHLDGII